MTEGCKLAAQQYVKWFGMAVIPAYGTTLTADGRRFCTCRKGPLCESGGKHPVISAWTKQPATSLADVEAYWEEYPDANVGIVTGTISRIWVLDLDLDKPGGRESWERLCAEGEGQVWQPMRRHKTGGKDNFQIVFKLPPGVVVASGPFKGYPGVDIRGEGGMVIAPPSVSVKGPYATWDDENNRPGLAPDWLLEKVRAPEGTAAAPARGTGVYAQPEDVDRDTLPRKLQLLLGEEEVWPYRSKRFHYIVLELKEAGYTEGQAVTLMAEWCDFIQYTKYIGRVDAMVNLSWGKHRKGLEIGPIEGYSTSTLGALALAAQEAAPPTLEARLRAVDADPDAWIPPAHTQNPALDAALETMCPEFDFRYWFEHVDDEPLWVWEPFIQREGSIALFSKAKAGKSLIVLEAVAALCSGRTPPGATRARAPKHIAYFDKENPTRTLVKRLRKMGYKPEDFLPYLHYYRNPGLGLLDTKEGGALFVEAVKRCGAELVIIDTVSKFIEGEEDSATTINRMDAYALQPLTREGVAIIRLDHAGKDPTKGQRGSSAKSAIGDGAYGLVKNGPYIKLLGELRDDDSPDEILFIRRDDPLRHDVATDDEMQEYKQYVMQQKNGGDDEEPKRPPGRPRTSDGLKLNEVVKKLDAANVPLGTGWREAERLLRAAGISFNRNYLGKALDLRMTQRT